MKKILCFFLSLCLLIGCIPALAAETTLEVSFYGMTLLPSGEWRSSALSGSFTVLQDGNNVGKLTVNAFGSTKLTLNSG
ncbi:MAG: hypothetical protein IJ708_14150, partial [Clostridia bacterium]|nr:hypothetical protein [Clostridia bacterium]